MTTWRFIKAFGDGERFEFVPGHNIWDYTWKPVRLDSPRAPTGDPFIDMSAEFETAMVRDPIYGVMHEFRVYEVTVEARVIRFAASEFSNTIWGYYRPEDEA